MNLWAPQAVADLINDAGSWITGLIILYAIVRGIRTWITGK
jgi:hypothetical protein